MLGEALAPGQSELEEGPLGCKAEGMLDHVLAELETHTMAVDTLGSSAEAGALFEGLARHSYTACIRYGGSVCSPLLRVVRGTETGEEHQALGIRGAQQGRKLRVGSAGCKVACQLLEYNLRTSTDWNHPRVDTGRQHMESAAAAASASDTAIFVAVAVVQWPPDGHSVSAAGKRGTRPSVAASALVSVLSACAAACPVLVPAGGLFHGVVLASPLMTSAPRAPGPASLQEPRI